MRGAESQYGSDNLSSPHTRNSPRRGGPTTAATTPLSADRAERLVDRLAYEYEEKEMRRRRAAAAALHDRKTGQPLFQPKLMTSPSRYAGHNHGAARGGGEDTAALSPGQRQAAKQQELHRKGEARNDRLLRLRQHQEVRR